jgi:hypothetical protein
MKRDKKKIKNNEDGSIFIKIQCFSDISDAEDDNKNYKDTPISCAKNCPSHYHVRLDGKPVTLKMNQVKVYLDYRRKISYWNCNFRIMPRKVQCTVLTREATTMTTTSGLS